jgi:HlyD family secretion protein
MKKAIGVIVLLAAAGALSAWWTGVFEAAAAPTYRFVQVERGDVEFTVSATGSLGATTTVKVGTQVSGQIAEILVDFNDRVRKGDLVARIDPTLLEQEVRTAESNVARTQAEVAQRQREFDRASQLHARQMIAQSDFDTAEYTLAIAKTSLQSAELSLVRARRNLAYTEIRAPIDGVVVERNVDVGQTVAASLAAPQLFLIAQDLARMEMLVSVDESDIGLVKKGQHARFTVQAHPDRQFDATVRQVRLQSTSQQNVVTYTVVLDVDNRSGDLLPGMTATVDFVIARAADVLRVPNAALRFRPTDAMRTAVDLRGRQADAGTARLWYLDGAHRLSVAIIRTGLTDGKVTEVAGEGLLEGMEVIAAVIDSAPASSTNPFQTQQQNNRQGPPPGPPPVM